MMGQVYLPSPQTVTLVAVTCGECGIIFAAPDRWLVGKKESGGGFSCPNGCQISYGDSEARHPGYGGDDG
jgi:hypothetical protein